MEEGFEAVLTRKYNPNSARPRIFDGAAEAKLIALACSEPPKGRSRWTLALLEDKVVELRWTPETGQVAKRESSLGVAGRPKVRHGQYSEEAQR